MRTRMYGGVTGKASDGLPMSIVARFAGSVALDADQFRPFLVLVGVGVGLGEGVGVGVGLGDE